jgi:ankyrin repeat protein
LIAKGVDVNAQDGSKYNALMYAVTAGNNEVVKILLENGAKLNMKTKSKIELL